jgi:hypothetical protein
MSAVMYDVKYQEERNRVTTAFRLILAIPHLIVAGLWGYFAELLAVIQWFIILFTGKRNEGIWNLQNSYLGYYSRVLAYVDLLYDEYPPFGEDPNQNWVRYSLQYQESADRLTSALRIIWAIPAILIMFVLSIAGFFVLLVSWFAIVITGKHGRGLFVFLLKVLRFTISTMAYVLLMTDTYPKYESAPATTTTAPVV